MEDFRLRQPTAKSRRWCVYLPAPAIVDESPTTHAMGGIAYVASDDPAAPCPRGAQWRVLMGLSRKLVAHAPRPVVDQLRQARRTVRRLRYRTRHRVNPVTVDLAAVVNALRDAGLRT